MGSRIYVEWINGIKAVGLYKSRRENEISLARELEPERAETDIALPIDDDSCWNWVSMEECRETKTFTTLADAKEWAEINYGFDYFSRPLVKQDEWGDHASERDAETVVKLEYEGGGEWFDWHAQQAAE